MLKKYLIPFIILLFLVFPIFVFAEAGNPPAGNPPAGTTSGGEPVKLTNPLTGKTTFDEKTEGIPTLLGNVINAILGIVGSLALVMFIYGGIIWMTSSGNAEQVTKGKNIIIWATIGLVVIFSAYALVNFVLTKALGVT